MWYEALLGGVLIGLAAAGLMALHGRILGVSGIYAGLFSGEPGWRIPLLVGMIAGGMFLARLTPDLIPDTRSLSLSTLALAGLLVGLGTRLGSGCTSGHGVCGLARLSTRSLVATVTFMAAGAVTVLLVKYIF